jgi:glycosyltransferase involved in cell wall biosynthesis
MAVSPPRAIGAVGAGCVDRVRNANWSHPRWNGGAPRVSVIVPTFNRADFLPTTIASIFEQTMDIHELLVVDDGSTDRTDRAIGAVRLDHPDWDGRLKYFWQKNQGKSAALNVGLAHATGDWIAFNDSDDIWRPDKLRLQFAALSEHVHANVCFTDVRFVNNPTLKETAFELVRLSRSSPFGLEECKTPLYFAGWPGIYMQSILVRRDTMAQVGEFDVSIRMGMDVDFAFRLGLISPMCYVNRPLVDVDRTPHRTLGLTTEYPANCLERLDAHRRMTANWLKSTRASHPELVSTLQHRLWSDQSKLANHYLCLGDHATAQSILRGAAWQYPRLQTVAKFVWSILSPRSLTREIVRRQARHEPPSVNLLNRP